jgi:hypothetical protein
MSARLIPSGRQWLCSLTIVAALLLSVLAITPVSGATSVIYYKETGHYVRGVFRDFWDKNGGLPNFGLPLTEEYFDPQTGRVFQYFERARFERAQAASTTVDLGLIGREVLGSRTFAAEQPITNTSQRRYFPQTRHIVQYGFKEVWDTRGGTKVFGLPLSAEIEEPLSDGQVHTVQWFERARFEYWGNLPPGKRVLLSALGRQRVPSSLTAPLAPNAPPSRPLTPGTPTPTPAPSAPPPSQPPPPSGGPLQRPLIPQSRNARVVPQAGQPGQTFVFVANGFQSKERVSIWLNLPDSEVVGANFQLDANAQGGIEPVQFTTGPEAPLGVWSFVAHGNSSNREAVGFFLLIGAPIGRAPAPGPGVPPNVDARVEPRAGPAGTIFFFDAFGFRAGEDVQIAITRSDGQRTTADFIVKADGSGSIRYAGVYYATGLDYPLGLYTFTARGQTSGKVSTAYFVLTP